MPPGCPPIEELMRIAPFPMAVSYGLEPYVPPSSSSSSDPDPDPTPVATAIAEAVRRMSGSGHHYNRILDEELQMKFD